MNKIITKLIDREMIKKQTIVGKVKSSKVKINLNKENDIL